MKKLGIGVLTGLVVAQVILVADGSYSRPLDFEWILLITGGFAFVGLVFGSPSSRNFKIDDEYSTSKKIPHTPSYDDGSVEGRALYGYYSVREDPQRYD